MKRLLLFLFLTALSLSGNASAGIIVIGNLARTATVQPGGAFEGVIFVKNMDSPVADVRLSQADYAFQADGSNDYGAPGRAPRSNADWMSVTPTRLRIAPGETVPVRYKGRAPGDPKLNGTYWSIIIVEPATEPAITPEGKVDQVAIGLQTKVRFAVQIVTEMGQTGRRSLMVQRKRLVQEEANRALELDIANDGERLLIPKMTLELFDSQGRSLGRFDAGRARIYPGCSARAKFNLTDVPAGKYTAMLLLDSGDAQVMGAQYDLELGRPLPHLPQSERGLGKAP